MKFLSDILAKAGLVVDGVVAFNNTATGLTPSTGDNSTKLATTAFVKSNITGLFVPYTGATGIVDDTDAETRYQDAFTAAQTRLKKAGQRANVDVAALPTGTKAGALSMPTRQGASGGIMQASLGSYAAGGNPRLLKGPGDGMSDNIPATIGGKQPARLADGEFVVPADVVSHLGNGSTEAGAKKLHQMMDKIRMDRTGKKKQAPAVKAGKYIPK
jgi:hypothetical protein